MKPCDQRPLVIVCAHAGGSAGSYRALARALPSYEIRALDRPGSGMLSREAFIEDWQALRDQIIVQIARLSANRPFILLGHSLGAILAYEVAQSLQDDGRLQGLVVSGASAPRVFNHAHKEVPSDEVLWQMVVASGLLPLSKVSDIAKQFVLPGLRKDIALCLSYQPLSSRILATPTALLYGSDDVIAPRHSVLQWERAVASVVHSEEVTGDHFFIMKNPSVVARALEAVLHAANPELRPASAHAGKSFI